MHHRIRFPRCCALVLSLASMAVNIGFSAQTSAPQRPGFQFLRWQEDWSVTPRLAANDTDPFDALKHVPLGSGWASFGGDFRIRLEDWQGFNFGAPPPASHDDAFVLTRFRAHADVHAHESIRLFTEVKGAYASDRNLPGGVRVIDEDKFELQQLFADFRFELASNTSLVLRTGRQALVFGAQRLVSPLPWANSLRTWDGVEAIVTSGDWTVTLFGAAFVPVDRDGIGEANSDELLYGVYARRAVSGTPGGLEIYALRNEWAMLRGFNGTIGEDRRWTLGARQWGPFAERGDYEFEASHQTGSTGLGDVSAWSLASQLGWQLRDDGALRLWGGLDWASGDDSPGGDVGTFNQLYPLGHAYFGAIDTIGRQNIIDLSVGLTWKATSQLSVTVGGHAFRVDRTEDAIYNAGGGVVRPGGSYMSSQIGREIDVTARWSVSRHVVLGGGYGHFFAGDVIDQSGPADDIDFGYVETTFTF